MEESFTYKGVTIHADKDAVEEEVYTYIDEMEMKEFFDLETIHIMPDVHVEPESRTLIGFTMPFADSLSPEIIGPDAGCGVAGAKLNSLSEKQISSEIISAVEQKIPLGRGEYSAPNREREDMVHVKDEFPYDIPTARLKSFNENVDHNIKYISEFLDSGGYSFDWLMNDLIPRVGLQTDPVISGLGTLGGGNHFIEIGIDEDENIWILCHSGSRKVGGAIFGHHVDIARKHHIGLQYKKQFKTLGEELKYLKFDVDTTDPVDIFEWVTGGKNESHMRKKQIREEYTGEKIDSVFKNLSPDVDRDSIQWPILTGKSLGQYYIDMIFAQVYAEVNRRTMIDIVCDQLMADVEIEEYIDNPHNLLSFTDGIIRKGAMSANQGEKGVLPFNMDEGAVIITGKGNVNSNSSAPHGAGRVGSATEARELFEDGKASEPSVLTNSSDAGEYPHAYKSKDSILPYITSFAEVDTYISPLYNIKE